MLNNYIQELSKEWELSVPLKENLPGSFIIPLDQGLILTISTLPNGFLYFYCLLAPIPKGQEELLLTKALQANLFGQGTKGALLGLNESGTVLTLSRSIDYDVNFKEFRDLVEDFINTIDYWLEEIINKPVSSINVNKIL